MNERIKELWEEATVSTWPRPGKFTAGEYDYHLAKFAELIIQDCIGIAHEVGRNPFIEACQERSKIIKNIEKHFGVEE